MKDCLIYNLYNYNLFYKHLKSELTNKKLAFMCIGTKKYFYDIFGVLVGDALKGVKVYSFGSSKREVNGLNYKKVYEFLKVKLPMHKIVVIDSVYLQNSSKKPLLIFKKSPINVSGINNKDIIGDYGILFNSFSYSNKKVVNIVVELLKKSIDKLCQNN